jgi:hypothetical protein
MRSISMHLNFNKEQTELGSLCTVAELVQENEILETLQGWPAPEYFAKTIAKERQFDICKVPMTSLMLFLHLDHGFIKCEGNQEFTPFASPVANSRSIHKEHVENLGGQIRAGKQVVALEDFAIAPFLVVLPEQEGANNETMEYQCTLDRDNASSNIVEVKRAKPISAQDLKEMYQGVSDLCQWFILFHRWKKCILTMAAQLWI